MTALLFAKNETHADELIVDLIRDCAEGRSDRESEALRLAKLWGINGANVAERFAEARDALREREQDSWVRRFRARRDLRGEGPLIDATAQNVSGKADDKAQLDAALMAESAPKAEPQADSAEPTAEPPLKAGLPAVIPQSPPLVPLNDALALMNSKHAILDNVGGKTVIGCWEESDGGYPKLIYQNKESFWPGDWSLIYQHLFEVIADGNPESAEYVLRWLAWAIQNPDKQAEVCLVLIGEKGTGKNTLARCLQPIFGGHAFEVTDREQVIGKFNGHLEDCILFIANEAYWGGDKRCVGRLQGMITEATLSIERKGFDAYQAKNFLHVLMLAEPGWVIPAGRFERRYAALKVSDKHREERDYFKPLNRQMANGGIEAMFYDLKNVGLGDWHPRDIPKALLRSGALAEQQTRSLPPWEQWYLSLLQDGKLPGASNKKPNAAYTLGLLESVKDRIPRLKFDASEITLRDFLLRMGCTKYRSSIGNGWSFPPLAIARSDWDKAYGAQPWDNPEAEWGDKIPSH